MHVLNGYVCFSLNVSLQNLKLHVECTLYKILYKCSMNELYCKKLVSSYEGTHKNSLVNTIHHWLVVLIG